MYQHDLVVSDLSQRLSEVIEECVNTGGVDLNACSAYLLTYLSGMNTSRAKAVIAHRDQHGKFASVAEIKKVKGIGDVTFRNAAGFLRVYGGLEVLDATAVHPDHYDILRDTLDWAHVEFGNDDNMLERKKQKFDVSKAKTKRKRAYKLTAENIGNAFVADLLRKAVENVSKLPPCIVLSLRKTLNDGKHEDESSSYIDSQALSSVINNWIKWLAPHSIRQINHVPWASDVAPGKPPVLKNRATLLTARQRTADIKPGSVTAIEGTIKNIVPFGAFVDVGMSNDGLLHRTQFLPDHQNIDNSKNDSYCAYRMKDIVVGQRVHVFVLSITPPNRIALGFSPPTDSAKKYAEVELGFKSNTPDASLSIPEISAKKRKRFDIARNP